MFTQNRLETSELLSANVSRATASEFDRKLAGGNSVNHSITSTVNCNHAHYDSSSSSVVINNSSPVVVNNSGIDLVTGMMIGSALSRSAYGLDVIEEVVQPGYEAPAVYEALDTGSSNWGSSSGSSSLGSTDTSSDSGSSSWGSGSSDSGSSDSGSSDWG